MRRAHDTAGALEQAEEAHSVLQRPESALELGKALTYVHDFPRAVSLLHEACGTKDVRGQLVAGTQLVDTLRRRAEVEASEMRNPTVALDTLNEALREGLAMLANGVRDQRLEEQLFECITDAFAVAAQLPDASNRDYSLRLVISAMASLPPNGAGGSRPYLEGHIARLLAKADLPDDIVQSIEYLRDFGAEGKEGRSSTNRSGLELAGRIKSWKPERHFGFISAVDGSGDYFFHAADLVDPVDQIFIGRGQAVQFVAVVDKNRKKGRLLRLRDAPDLSELKGREITVLTVGTGHLIAEDAASGMRVFVGRHALRDRRQWSAIRQGSKLKADVESAPRDRFAAVPGSVTLQ